MSLRSFLCITYGYEERIPLPNMWQKAYKVRTRGYSFQCLYCDEDFTESEVIIKTEGNEKEKQ